MILQKRPQEDTASKTVRLKDGLDLYPCCPKADVSNRDNLARFSGGLKFSVSLVGHFYNPLVTLT